MEFRDAAEYSDFRQEVRSFIDANLPDGWGGSADMEDSEYAEETRKFWKALASKNWLAMAWPEEYKGLNADHWQQLVMNEEMAYHRAPGAGANMGIMWVGPSLMLYGTDEQKDQHVNAIANGETWWATLYSEPGAGSDLASLQTRAVEDGDDYVINGQKIWTSGAHHSDWGWLAARTDPDAPKHKGITMFMFDMKTPGVTVQPLINMAESHSFNEVFFEDVRIPKSQVVGEVNRGWYHMAVALDFERSGIGAFAGGRRSVEEYTQIARDNPQYLEANPGVRYELADRALEVQVGTYLAYRITHLQKQGVVANYEASVSKLFGSELGQRIAATGLKLIGQHGTLNGSGDGHTPLDGRIATSYRAAVSGTIAAGTSEIQRGIIATRGLGLPRQ
jgi:alkylation response protein AidB-like acyl-CoA dehydrogenase